MTSALIAEDEPLLAGALASALEALWPELELLPIAANGESALALALKHLPEVLFLDIKMPVLSGIEVAKGLADQWPAERATPLIVFVTAYDSYALQAFDARAIDYVLKPVDNERLAQTIHRLAERLKETQTVSALSSMERMIDQLRGLNTSPRQTKPLLKHLQVGVGLQVLMLPLDEVALFEAADKYVRVVTHANKEYLIRTPLKDLLESLDPTKFWQVHRGTIVAVHAVHAAVRQEDGRMHLTLKGVPERPLVSRLYSSLFKAM